ncbi:AsnC family transcriptional regulator [Mycolicibacterium canariasense]|uniref:AsnC family transcriptional regulator n=2 Tax=Mycolicibacterium canariasense TaxID=228230 RepID=A0A100WI75_MYCCR|nr:AsnC family transcriptional regulator [Mycolicibacterium canariasense]
MCNLPTNRHSRVVGMGIVTNKTRVDAIDARIIRALNDDPRATVIALADATGLSRNTVQARLSKLESQGVLRSLERRVDPAALGYPLTAFILTRVTQRKLARIAASLEQVPEVIEVHGLAGVTDLMVHVVAREADDLYRIAGQILDIDGVEQTTTSLVMRKLVDYRITPLLDDLDDR